MEPFETTKIRLDETERAVLREQRDAEYDSRIESTKNFPLGGHVIHPNRWIWAAITAVLISATYIVFQYEVYNSREFFAAISPILTPVLTLWAATRLIPYCHCIQLDPYGIYRTRYFKTSYHSWRQVQEIDIGQTRRSTYIYYNLVGNQGLVDSFWGPDVKFSGYYTLGKRQIVALMQAYKYQSKKNDLGWSNPNPRRYPSLVSPGLWGRKAGKDGVKISRIGFLERFRGRWMKDSY